MGLSTDIREAIIRFRGDDERRDQDRMQSHTEPSTERPNRLLIFTVLGFLGLILGMFVPFVAEIGMSVLSAGVLLWFMALLARKDHKWSSEVNFYGEALVIFGAMAVLGAGIGMWLRILEHF